MKKLILMFAALALLAAPAFADITMTFEEFLGLDGTPVGTFYKGVTFESGSGGSDWVARDANTGGYNVSSWPSGDGGGSYWINGYVFATTALDYSGNEGFIRFDNKDAKYVELSYAAYDLSGTGVALYLEAYKADGALMASDSGPSNLRPGNVTGPDTLRVDWNGTDPIAYVRVHDSGNFWLVDDIKTDASGITVVPAPAAVLLGMMGLGLVGWLKRRVG